MRRTLPLLALALAVPAAAQNEPIPDEERRPGLVGTPDNGACDFPLPGPAAEPAPPPPPGDFITSVFLETPQNGAIAVPLNVQLRLAGFFGDIDSGFVELVIDDEATETPVAFNRSGGRVTFDAPLAPNTTYRVYTRFTDPSVCPDCQPQIYTFLTGSAEDHTPPPPASELIAHLLVHDECTNFGFGNHTLMLAANGFDGDAARVEISAARRDAPPIALFDTPLFNPQRIEVTTNLGQTQIALNDAVRVAVTPVDLAGNVGEPIVVRTRARSFTVYEGGPVESLEPIQCELSGAPSPALVSEAPRGGLVEVAFPFEASPVAARQGEREVALIPVEDTAAGQRLLPAEELSAGTWELVPVDCPFCACAGCALSAGGQFEVGADEDLEPPSAPVVLGVDEVFEPPFAADVCAPDDTAVIVRIEPGVDDATGSADLRYHASIRIDDLPPVAVGRFLAPAVVGDAHEVRLETSQYGRLIDQDFELELTVVDLADQEASASFAHEGVPAGCASTDVRGAGVPASLALVFVALAALRRRRR